MSIIITAIKHRADIIDIEFHEMLLTHTPASPHKRAVASISSRPFAVDPVFVSSLFIIVPLKKLFKLKCAGVQLIVCALFCNQLIVAAAFDDAPVVKYHNCVGVSDG